MILSELAIIISILGGLFSIVGIIIVWISQGNKHKTLTAVQEEKLRNQLSEINQLRIDFEKYVDRNDSKFKDVFAKIDEHYAKLDNKIDSIREALQNFKT